MIEVFQISALNDNYIYIIIDKKTGKSACVDPSVSEPVLSFLEKKNLGLDFILNTHHHYDHVGGNLELKKQTNCKIVGNVKDKHRIPGIDIFVNNNEVFKIGASEALVFDIPGHTIGHICYFFSKDLSLFCGDTLFSLGCGRMFEGNAKQMSDSLKKIRALPDKTLIYCGHEYTESNASFALNLEPENIGLKKKVEEIKSLRQKSKPTVPSLLIEEKRYNPFLRFDDLDYLSIIGMTDLSYLEAFEKIRKMKDNF